MRKPKFQSPEFIAYQERQQIKLDLGYKRIEALVKRFTDKKKK